MTLQHKFCAPTLTHAVCCGMCCCAAGTCSSRWSTRRGSRCPTRSRQSWTLRGSCRAAAHTRPACCTTSPSTTTTSSSSSRVTTTGVAGTWTTAHSQVGWGLRAAAAAVAAAAAWGTGQDRACCCVLKLMQGCRAGCASAQHAMAAAVSDHPDRARQYCTMSTPSLCPIGNFALTCPLPPPFNCAQA